MDRDHVHSFVLATTSELSRRVTSILPRIADALHSGSEAEFGRDQNRALVHDLDAILTALEAILRSQTDAPVERQDSIQILKRIRVCVLDLSEGTPQEQALQILLNARGCTAPSLFWGRLVFDCASFAASRRSVTAEFLTNRYKRFFDLKQVSASPSEGLRVELFDSVRMGSIQTGREVVAGTMSAAGNAMGPVQSSIESGLQQRIGIFEFYRFDDTCRERLTFSDGKCMLQNGLEIELLARAATFEGLTRILKRKLSKQDGDKASIVIFQSNLDEDEEFKPCAVERRRLLEKRAEVPISLHCLHCGKPISSNDADYVEYVDESEGPSVGLAHVSCTRADDRVVGSIRSDFFESYGFLRNFDAVTWFRQIARGQGAYGALRAAGMFEAVLTWSGRSVRDSVGTCVVEFELDDNTSEFSYHRGQLERYSRQVAEQYSNDLNKSIALHRSLNDPLCLSEETLQFGQRSVVLRIVGADEKLRELVKARVKAYRPSMVERYNFRDNWFGPVAFVRRLPDEQPMGAFGSTFLITEPLHLDRFLSNWRSGGLEVGDYEVPILATDEEFDFFAREIFAEGGEFLIDPLFTPGEQELLTRGTRLIPLNELKSRLGG